MLQLREQGSSQAAAERQVALREPQLEAQENVAYPIGYSLRSLPPSSPIASTSSDQATTFIIAGLPVT